jgi:DNA-3-methyladenine glycosylase I
MTILRKRDNFRAAYDDFDPAKIAQYNQMKFDELMDNPGVIRNRRKIEATAQNARAFLAVQAEFGSFDAYMWQFVGGEPKVNSWKTISEIPAQTEESLILSKDLKQRGFNFVGPTIIYAHMQATGMVNDHTTDCFRYLECQVE